MGGSISRILSGLWSKKEIRILILGLDNAGKTTLLYRLKIGEVVTTIPTIGFNVESVTYKNLNFNVWDLGGQTSIRPYWRCYYANTAAVIFVIDSTDIERLGTASDELAAMLNEDELREAALLVFANKQDQPGAKGAGDISEALRLGQLKDRNWSIVACSAVDGKGVDEGMDWLVKPKITIYPRHARGFMICIDQSDLKTVAADKIAKESAQLFNPTFNGQPPRHQKALFYRRIIYGFVEPAELRV